MFYVFNNFYSNKIRCKVKISLTASFYIVPSRESLFARTNIKNKYYNEKLKWKIKQKDNKRINNTNKEH